MTSPAERASLLVTTLCHPERARGFDKGDWEVLVWQSRAAELMAQLQQALVRVDLLRTAPSAARRHLDLAIVIAERHTRAVRSELRGLQQALQPLQVPVVLLKGAAYTALSHRVAAGRIFNDIDILVPKSALRDAEQRLSWAGWFSLHTTVYDERYYRKWMHEIPPLAHGPRYGARRASHDPAAHVGHPARSGGVVCRVSSTGRRMGVFPGARADGHGHPLSMPSLLR